MLLHTCVHTDRHRQTHTHIHMRGYIDTYGHVHRHICIRTYMHTHVRTYIHTCIHTCMRTCMQAYIHTYIHTYIPIHINTYACDTACSTLIAANPPTGGDFQNPHSRNLLLQNKSTPNPYTASTGGISKTRIRRIRCCKRGVHPPPFCCVGVWGTLSLQERIPRTRVLEIPPVGGFLAINVCWACAKPLAM